MYLKVKSRSHFDAAHLHPLVNVPTTYEVPTPDSFCDTAQTALPTQLDAMGENNTHTIFKGCGSKNWNILLSGQESSGQDDRFVCSWIG